MMNLPQTASRELGSQSQESSLITIQLKGPSEPVAESGSGESDRAVKELEAAAMS